MKTKISSGLSLACLLAAIGVMALPTAYVIRACFPSFDDGNWLSSYSYFEPSLYRWPNFLDLFFDFFFLFTAFACNVYVLYQLVFKKLDKKVFTMLLIGALVSYGLIVGYGMMIVNEELYRRVFYDSPVYNILGITGYFIFAAAIFCNLFFLSRFQPIAKKLPNKLPVILEKSPVMLAIILITGLLYSFSTMLMKYATTAPGSYNPLPLLSVIAAIFSGILLILQFLFKKLVKPTFIVLTTGLFASVFTIFMSSQITIPGVVTAGLFLAAFGFNLPNCPQHGAENNP